jgi:hypothetical protein
MRLGLVAPGVRLIGQSKLQLLIIGACLSPLLHFNPREHNGTFSNGRAFRYLNDPPSWASFINSSNSGFNAACEFGTLQMVQVATHTPIKAWVAY